MNLFSFSLNINSEHPDGSTIILFGIQIILLGLSLHLTFYKALNGKEWTGSWWDYPLLYIVKISSSLTKYHENIWLALMRNEKTDERE